MLLSVDVKSLSEPRSKNNFTYLRARFRLIVVFEGLTLCFDGFEQDPRGRLKIGAEKHFVWYSCFQILSHLHYLYLPYFNKEKIKGEKFF